MKQTHYEALHVAPDATASEIKSAYRDLIRIWHPDRLTTDALRARATVVMASLNEAYSVLSDTNRRQEYDARLLDVISERRDAELHAASRRKAIRAEIADFLALANEFEAEIPRLQRKASTARKRAADIEWQAIRDGFFPKPPPGRSPKEPTCGRCGGPRRFGDAFCGACT
jgi:curved DNA-binding protein CbpA